MRQLYIGLISGTSMDAVDAVLVDYSDPQPILLASHSQAYPKDLYQEVLQLCSPGHNEIYRLGAVDVEVGRLFAETANQLLAKTTVSATQIKAIGSHGQTIRHHPYGEIPFTLQIGDPNTIAELTGITTIADFRRRDMAKGGQGAPLAPAFHYHFLGGSNEDRIVLNIGGIANITWLPADKKLSVIGFDTGPGNTLMDAWVKKNKDQAYDEAGVWAASGIINEELLTKFLLDSYFSLPYPKSTGKEYFNLKWLENFITFSDQPENIQATLCELTAISIAAATKKLMTTGKVLVCGGGMQNSFLIQRLNVHCPQFSIESTETYGIDPQWVEAMAFAWLAKQTLEQKPGNMPEVTGARGNSVLGGIYF